MSWLCRLFFDDDANQEDRMPVSYQLIAPGVTPWRSTLSEETGANNPGIRLVSFDTSTGRVSCIRVNGSFTSLVFLQFGEKF